LVSRARATRGLRRPSPGLMARLGVPVGRRVRQLCAVGDQTGRPPGEKGYKLGRGVARQLVWSLCSQSPHDEAVVARCAQWRPHQPPRWLRVKSREISQSMRAVKDSLAAPLRSLSDIAFVTRRRRCCRCKAAGMGKPDELLPLANGGLDVSANEGKTKNQKSRLPAA
jgi:hypothetical protein